MRRISCHSFSRRDASTRAPFQFLRCTDRAPPRVATLPRGLETLRPQWSSAPPPAHKKRKIEGRVTPALCNLSLRVRMRSTAMARREFRTAVSLSLNYSLTRVWRVRRRQVQREKEHEHENNKREWREAVDSSQHGETH